MINRKMVKKAMAGILFTRMLNGEIIIVEYADEKKDGVRKYFPEHMIHMFRTDEIIEIIKCAMGEIHKELSEAGKGEVIFIWIKELKYISYGMLIYRKLA